MRPNCGTTGTTASHTRATDRGLNRFSGGVNARAAVISAYAGICLIWGTTWYAIKVGLPYIPPITSVGARFVIAGTVMAIAALAMGRLHRSALSWKLIWMMVFGLFSINYVLIYLAETHLGSGIVAVLFGTQPFFVFFFGYLFAGERSSPMTWLGAALALAGVAVISLVGEQHGSWIYALAAIASAAVAAVGMAYAKRKAHFDPLATLPVSMLIAGAATLTIGIVFEHPVFATALAPVSLASLLYLAVLGSAVAFFLNLWLLKRISVAAVGLTSLVTPIIAIFVGVVFGGEAFGSRDIVGAVLVIAGVWVALKHPAKGSATHSA